MRSAIRSISPGRRSGANSNISARPAPILKSAKETKIFGLSDFLIGRYRKLADGFYEANRTLSVNHALWGSVLSALGTLGYYGAYAYIAWRTIHGEFTIGDLTFLAGSFRRLRNLLEDLLVGFSTVAGQALYLEDLFSFFAIEPEIGSPANPRPFPAPIREGFRFENVGFRYPGVERWAVRHLNFTVQAGEVLALVGENGAGKTTIVKLLARLYDPDEGRILLDGVDLQGLWARYAAQQYRRHLPGFRRAIISRAAENIAVGRIEMIEDRARIVDAAHRSLADARDRTTAARRYDQIIGKRFKRGVELSGGEWQKLAIARAYMRDSAIADPG